MHSTLRHSTGEGQSEAEQDAHRRRVNEEHRRRRLALIRFVQAMRRRDFSMSVSDSDSDSEPETGNTMGPGTEMRDITNLIQHREEIRVARSEANLVRLMRQAYDIDVEELRRAANPVSPQGTVYRQGQPALFGLAGHTIEVVRPVSSHFGHPARQGQTTHPPRLQQPTRRSRPPRSGRRAPLPGIEVTPQLVRPLPTGGQTNAQNAQNPQVPSTSRQN